MFGFQSANNDVDQDENPRSVQESVAPAGRFHVFCYKMTRDLRQNPACCPHWFLRVQAAVPYYGTPWGLVQLTESADVGEMYLLSAFKVMAHAHGEITLEELSAYNPYKKDYAKGELAKEFYRGVVAGRDEA